MHSWFRLSCLILVMNNVIMEPPRNKFNYITLGHSGFLIFPKKNRTDTDSGFQFCSRVKDGKKTAFSNCCRTQQYYNHQSRHHHCKIHSLEPNTLYKVVIQEVGFTKTYTESLEMKTNKEMNTKPAKPDFELEFLGNFALIITWLPCGRERNCSGKEAGTHFAVKFKVVDKRGEINILEYQNDYIYVDNLLRGTLYHVEVISINGNSETASNSQEIFLKPETTAVRSVKVISFSNASILVSWKSPKYSLGKSEKYRYKVSASNSSFLCTYSTCKSSAPRFDYNDEEIFSEEILLDKPKYLFKLGDTYTIIITPCVDAGDGMSTEVQYTIPVNKDEF